MEITFRGKVKQILASKHGESNGHAWISQQILLEGSDGKLYKLPLLNKEVEVDDNICATFEFEAMRKERDYFNGLNLVDFYTKDAHNSKRSSATNRDTTDIDSLF